MDPQSNLLNLETLFPNGVKDVRNHLNQVYENSAIREFIPSVVSLEQENSTLTTSLPITVKTEPTLVQEDLDNRNPLSNMNGGISSINLVNDRIRPVNSVAFNNPYSSPINTCLSNQMIYSNYDSTWNQTIQSKINVPLNSTEGHTELMLMILKAQNDNQNLLMNIFKRMETIERKIHIEPPPINTNFIIPSIPAETIQQFESNPMQQIYTLPEQPIPTTDFLIAPMENDYHLRQFENSLNQATFRISVVQFLRQKTGSNIRETVRRMIFALITKEFSLKFNRTGANNKYAFKNKLEPLIKEAIFGLYTCSERDVEIAIVRTLKEAKDRVSSRKK